MKNNAIPLLSFLLLFSCNTKAQKSSNTQPMYGAVPKTEEEKKIDEKFTEGCLAQFGTTDSAVAVHIGLAWNYFYNNDLQTAMKRFNQTWLLNDQFPDSYFGLAALMDMQGNHAASERFYRMGIEKDTSTKRAAICYQRIADCKEQLKDIPGTIEAYIKIIAIDSQNAIAFKKIGFFKANAGQADEALKAYNKAIELDAKDPVTYNNRGYLYQNVKKYKNAIADYTKSVELDPKYISAYANRGVTEIECRNYEVAKNNFEICVQLDSTSASMRRILGVSKLYLKDKVGACKDFEKAKQLGDELAGLLSIMLCKG